MKTGISSDATAKYWMLVDDDEGALALMHEIVSGLGARHIDYFTSSREALATFEAAPESFELVITDFQMPGMDGVELSHRLRQIAPQIKILLVTGSHLTHAVARDGFCGLLQKPFQPAALKQALEAIGIGQPANHPTVLTTTLF